MTNIVTYTSPVTDLTYTFMPNVAAFQAVLDRITYHPEVWNQGEWLVALSDVLLPDAVSPVPGPECGTVGCLAGNVSLMAGARPLDVGSISCWVITADAREVTVLEHAMEVLGVPEGVVNASNLFGGSRTLSQLWDIADELCGGVLVRPSAEAIAEAQQVSWHLYGGGRYGQDGDFSDQDAADRVGG